MCVDHDFVIIARRDVDGSEVNVDDKFAAGLRGFRFVNVFFARREGSEVVRLTSVRIVSSGFMSWLMTNSE